jgi:hypothetical protein
MKCNCIVSQADPRQGVYIHERECATRQAEPIPCPGCDEGPRCQCWNTTEGRVCGVCETPVRGERCLGTFEFAAVGAC